MKWCISKATVLHAAVLCGSVQSFGIPAATTTRGAPSTAPSTSALSAERRTVLTQAAASAAAALFVATTTTVAVPAPAHAALSGVNKVNAKLKAFGLPPVASLDGFVPLLDTYGKGKNRTPLLVTFSHPLSWVVTLPSNNVNGEDGTIQAGDYGKGDTATLYVYTDRGVASNTLINDKALVETVLKRSISQRGDNMYQNFKLTKLVEGATGGGSNNPFVLNGQSYVLADFKYQLLTGAGFEVDRKGVAAITSQGGQAVQVLWAASTEARYKKTESTLRTVVESFRCYADGINFTDELVSYVE